MDSFNSGGEQNKTSKLQVSTICGSFLGFYSLRNFLEVFEMVSQEKSIQFLLQIAKISSLSLAKCEGLTRDK